MKREEIAMAVKRSARRNKDPTFERGTSSAEAGAGRSACSPSSSVFSCGSKLISQYQTA